MCALRINMLIVWQHEIIRNVEERCKVLSIRNIIASTNYEKKIIEGGFLW